MQFHALVTLHKSIETIIQSWLKDLWVDLDIWPMEEFEVLLIIMHMVNLETTCDNQLHVCEQVKLVINLSDFC